MNRTNKTQKDKITQFRGITGASEKIANDCLKFAGWTIEGAIDYFYASGLAASIVPAPDAQALDNLYAKYKDSDGDIIGPEGIMRFCQDLQVDPTDIVVLVLSWHFNAEVMCEYKRNEFMGGMQKLGCDSIEKLAKKLPDLRAELKDSRKFADIYNYAFLFSREKGVKCVQLEAALGMWKLLFSGDNDWPLIDDWCEFLLTHHNRALSKDTWAQVLDFAKNIKPDFSNFDENSAWPYLIDEFVEHMQEKRKMSD